MVLYFLAPLLYNTSMSIEKFGLLGQMPEQQTVEEVSTEEQQVGRTLESEIESPEKEAEQREGSETLESRYDRLENEALEIKRNREITFALSMLQSEGLQSLITEYGADSVFGAIKSQNESNRQGYFSTFEVVRALEPDKSKRAELFNKMLGDAEQKAEQFEQRWQEGNEGEHDYFEGTHGSGGNFVRGAQFRIEAMRNLDSFLGKVAPQRHYKILGTRITEFAALVSQYEDEEAKLKQELEQAGNDIFNLVEQRSRVAKDKTAKLTVESEQVCEELKREIQDITNGLNDGLEEFRARVVSDISTVGNLETASEEMRTALQDLLSKVEGEIIVRVEATEKEIAEKTAPLRQMMGKVNSLDRV